MHVAWMPQADETCGSSRLRCWMVADHIGHQVDIVRDASSFRPQKYDVIVVQKRHDLGKHMRKWMRTTPVVYDLCDLEDRVEPAHQVVVGSTELQKRIPGSRVVRCPVDVQGQAPEKCHAPELKRVVWFGLGCNVYHVRPVLKACRAMQVKLTVVTDLDGKRHHVPKWSGVEYREWSPETVDRDIQDCDVVACPFTFDRDSGWPEKWTRCKNENRVVKAWALGMPVVGTPIPSYVEAGLERLATTAEEWEQQLWLLRGKNARALEAVKGREKLSRYSVQAIGRRWAKVLEETAAQYGRTEK